MRTGRLGWWAAAALFMALAWPGAGTRGIIAEEIQPYLARYPLVLERVHERAEAMPPYEPDAPPRPRFVATGEWPVVGYDGASRVWPLFVRGHESALGSYVGIALAPILGGGVGGVRRSTVLLGVLMIVMLGLLARRLVPDEPAAATLAAAALAASVGFLFIGRSGYGFEVASRAAMLAAILLAAPKRPISTGRALAVGLTVGVAILCRATIAVALAPALLVLLSAKSRELAPARAFALTVGAVVVPLAAHALVARYAPFRAGAEPLAHFTVDAGRFLAVGRQLALQLAWLTDGGTMLRPLYGGAHGLDARHLILPALVGALPLAWGAWRWSRGRAGEGERMLICAALASAVAAALFYKNPDEFQLALALEPLFALALAEQAVALATPRRRLVAAAIILAVRGVTLGFGLHAAERPSNPMLSAKTQRAAVEKLTALGVRGDELVTTSYDQVGVLEAWSNGALAPAHAWPMLGGDPDGGWRALFATRPVRWVLLADGVNLFEGDVGDPRAAASSLEKIAPEAGYHVAARYAFPTESGAPGWSLVELATKNSP